MKSRRPVNSDVRSIEGPLESEAYIKQREEKILKTPHPEGNLMEAQAAG
jgi:hypothetical protein